MLWEPVEGEDALVTANVYPRGSGHDFGAWCEALQRVTNASGLELDIQPPSSKAHGGRRGEHTQHLKPLLEEMGEVYRTEPGAAW